MGEQGTWPAITDDDGNLDDSRMIDDDGRPIKWGDIVYRYYETKDGKPWAQWKGHSRDFILRKQTQVKPPGKGTKIHSCMECEFDMCDRCFKSNPKPRWRRNEGTAARLYDGVEA